MKIVADEHIPFLKGVLEPFGAVTYLPGQRITHADVREADAMLIRTRTRCNAQLLEGSRVRFIGSATIGFDHIDIEYCGARGIQWVNAPGCNASSVMQYVASALAYLSRKHGLDLRTLTLGIVGVGNVGSKVERLARTLGMRVLLNDPPRARREGSHGFVPLQMIMQDSDIITIHVPLERHGEDRTFHLCDRDFFSGLGKDPFLINTSRGEVVDTQALKEALFRKESRGAVIDVWENEPDIDPVLLSMAEIATPHIAGYSADGKANGTAMAVQSLSRYFQLGLDRWYPTHLPEPETPVIELVHPGAAPQEIILSCIEATYRAESDSQRLKHSPFTFEEQRENYPPRREFPHFRIGAPQAWEKAGKQLNALGFGIQCRDS